MSLVRGQHLIGQVIGTCFLEKQLGHGGSSAVFLAQSRSSDEKVAVKVFLPRSTMDKQTQKNFYRRFLREAQAASELDHPNILSIYSYGEHNGLPYIVMPYMPGGTLSEYVAKYGPLSLSEAQQYLEQISSALDYAHEQGCVHCDVKPANILLDGQGHVVLSDFGIVRSMQPDTDSTLPSIKSSEILMGTPNYISPEQALGQQLDGRSDVYSLAVTLFFLLAGEPPFKADSSIAMALMHVHEKPPALGMMRADITPQIDSVIGKALSKWPEERFQGAGEFSAAFTEAVTNADQSATPASGAKRKFNSLNSEGKQGLAALIPIVRVKSVWKSPFKLQRVKSVWNPPFKLQRVKSARKPPFKLQRKFNSLYSEGKQGLAALKPIVRVKSVWKPPLKLQRVKSVWKPPFKLQRVVISLMLLLAIVIGSIVTVNIISSFTNVRSHQQATPSTTHIDYLAGKQDMWPQSRPIFFFHQNGEYHIQNNSQNGIAIALYDFGNYLFTDFRLSVTTSEIHGSQDGGDYYGIIFRSSSNQTQYYLFEISAWEGGQYEFLRSDGLGDWHTLAFGIISPSLKKTNVITVEAKGNTFTFYVNQKPLVTFTDPSKQALTSGDIGLSVEEGKTEVAFSHLQVDKL